MLKIWAAFWSSKNSMLGKISREKDSFQKLVRHRVSQETHENFGRAKTPR